MLLVATRFEAYVRDWHADPRKNIPFFLRQSFIPRSADQQLMFSIEQELSRLYYLTRMQLSFLELLLKWQKIIMVFQKFVEIVLFGSFFSS